MAESNPEDVNAHALHLLCMEALGTIDDSPAEALAACTKMLQCDGSSHRYDLSHTALRLVKWQVSSNVRTLLRFTVSLHHHRLQARLPGCVA